MYILQEQRVNQKISELDKAWEKKESFALLPEKCPVSLEWVQEQFSRIPPALQRNHFILLTSGSTGEARLVIASRKRAQAMARLLHRAQDSAGIRETVILLPLSYCYAFVNQWLWARVFGRKINLTRGFAEPDLLRRSLDKAAASLICLVAAQVPLFEEYFPDAVFAQVNRCHFAGSPFPQEKLNFIRKLFPQAEIYNNYGCAEAMPRLTLRKALDSSDGLNLGKPLKGISLKSSRQGALLFKSPYGAVGYLEETGLRLIKEDEWIPTGDLAVPLPDGSWDFKGRANEVFKRSGEKIALPLILNTVKSVWPHQVAFYRETDLHGQPGYVLVLSPPPQPVQMERINQVLRSRLSRQKWPLRTEVFPRMPLLANGKIDYNTLAKHAGLKPHEPGANTEKLKKLILEVFLLNPAEFDFGLSRAKIPAWDSLGIVTLAAGIKRTFGFPMPPDEAAGLKGIADIVSWLRKKGVGFDE